MEGHKRIKYEASLQAHPVSTADVAGVAKIQPVRDSMWIEESERCGSLTTGGLRPRWYE